MLEKPIINPAVVLREEFDDWALLYDPRSGQVFGINPVGVFVWKLLDGKHSIEDIINELRKNCNDLPEQARGEVESFVQDLKKKGLAGSEV
ncbi:MAG: SynChlorMet cassette protein ScmD [Dehalobacter sp.]|nr:SynChlorMet cassette protein ScmD [Dehalobacter sp.]